MANETFEIGTFLVVCKNADCGNFDIELEVQAYIPADVWCGGCSTQITDIQSVN
jgi:hypothetical protein